MLEPLGEKGTRVEVIERVRSTPPADALLFFFDDLGEQVAILMKRRLEGRRDPTLLGRLRRQVRDAA